MTLKKNIALAALACTLAATAQAQDSTQWGIGLGAAVEHAPYRGVGDKTYALPLLMAENRWVSLLGNTLDLKLLSSETVSFRLRAQYAFDGYDADDSDVLQGMADRKGSLWLGAAAQADAGFATFTAEVLGDAGNKSKGTRVKLGMERSFAVGSSLQLTPRIAAHWQDRKAIGYYYGVRASEATASRAAYDGRATTNVELGLRTTYALAPRQMLLLDVSATRLGASIKDSPLVERSTQAGVRVGWLYRF